MSGTDRDSEAAAERWRELAAKELRGADPDTLVWTTPEGIPVKPLYTAADLEDLEAVGSLPLMLERLEDTCRPAPVAGPNDSRTSVELSIGGTEREGSPWI